MAGAAPRCLHTHFDCLAQVAREGTKKTVFTNFPELCKSLNRQHDHVMVSALLCGRSLRGACRSTACSHLPASSTRPRAGLCRHDTPSAALQAFVLAELGTSGNLDGENRLIVKGRFLPKGFEAVLRRYANECASRCCLLALCAWILQRAGGGCLVMNAPVLLPPSS